MSEYSISDQRRDCADLPSSCRLCMEIAFWVSIAGLWSLLYQSSEAVLSVTVDFFITIEGVVPKFPNLSFVEDEILNQKISNDEIIFELRYALSLLHLEKKIISIFIDMLLCEYLVAYFCTDLWEILGIVRGCLWSAIWYRVFIFELVRELCNAAKWQCLIKFLMKWKQNLKIPPNGSFKATFWHHYKTVLCCNSEIWLNHTRNLSF